MLSAKRSFDTMMDVSSPGDMPQTQPPCVEHRVSFLSTPTHHQHHLHTIKRARTPLTPQPHALQNRQHSPFLARSSDISTEDVEKMMPKRKRQRLCFSSMTDSDDDHTPEQEPNFTKDEVKMILTRALREMEGKLREQYDTILQDRLSEQFQNFTKFNDDYVSRRMRDSCFDYVS